MGFHHQKRIYVPGAIYFITTNTFDKYPYFANDILCELFVETLEFTSLIKGFNLHGLAINFEHLHLLIEPTGKYNYSEIMGSIKRNFARDCNDLMAGKSFLHDGKGGNDSEKSGGGAGRINRKYKDIRGNPIFLAHLERLGKLQSDYFKNSGAGPKVPFKWHNSFHDHLIRDERDYLNHLNYIMRQPIKHNLLGRKWYWITGDDWDEGN